MATFRGNFEVIFGTDKFQLLVEWLEKNKVKKIGMVVDQNLLNNSAFLRWKEFLEVQFTISFLKVLKLSSEPSYQFVDFEFESICAQEVDVLLAFGGGSVLDIAKGFSILYRNAGPSSALKGFNKVATAGIPLVLFPSTAGTGTEMTWTASFIDLHTKIKLGINGQHMFPSLSVLDPDLIVSAPSAVIISAALDVLVHAIEAVTSKNTTPFARTLGVSSTHKILQYLPLVYKSSTDIRSIEMLQIAAAEAGLAMLNSSGGPSSGISYPLGVHFGVPHGFAGGIILPKVIERNIELGYLGYNEFFYENSHANETLLDKMTEVYSLVDVPNNFRNWRFNGEEDVSLIYNLTLKERKENLLLNPVEFSNDSLMSLLTSFIQ